METGCVVESVRICNLRIWQSQVAVASVEKLVSGVFVVVDKIGAEGDGRCSEGLNIVLLLKPDVVIFCRTDCRVSLISGCY